MKKGYCFGMGHTSNKCFKHGKCGKAPFVNNNYLEVWVDDEKVMLEKLNRLCGANHDAFTGAKIPRRHILVEAVNGKTVDDCKVGHVDLSRSSTTRSKIFMHFMKGKISLSPMETILVIP